MDFDPSMFTNMMNNQNNSNQNENTQENSSTDNQETIDTSKMSSEDIMSQLQDMVTKNGGQMDQNNPMMQGLLSGLLGRIQNGEKIDGVQTNATIEGESAHIEDAPIWGKIANFKIKKICKVWRINNDKYAALEGDKVYREFIKNFRAEKYILDFSGVEVTNEKFFRSAVGKLYRDYHWDHITNRHIDLVGISNPGTYARLLQVIEDAKAHKANKLENERIKRVALETMKLIDYQRYLAEKEKMDTEQAYFTDTSKIEEILKGVNEEISEEEQKAESEYTEEEKILDKEEQARKEKEAAELAAMALKNM